MKKNKLIFFNTKYKIPNFTVNIIIFAGKSTRYPLTLTKYLLELNKEN